MNKRHLTLCIAFTTLSVGQALAREPGVPPPLAPPPAPAAAGRPPIPPPPPAPDRPVPPAGDERRHGHHDEPTTFLGVGVEPIPEWFGEQLNLPEGFGLLVNYVTPGSPAETAGVKPHDILKQINDQALANPDQLSSLVQSYPEGQEVTLTVLRKGQETKLTAKVQKRREDDRPPREVRRYELHRDRHGDEVDNDDLNLPPVDDVLKELGPQIGELARKVGREAADKVRREIMILRDKDGQISTSKLDLGQGRVLIRSSKGEVEIKGDKEGSTTVIKDPQGKEIYHGPTKDAPPGSLDQMVIFGDNGKISLTGHSLKVEKGDKALSYEMSDEDEGKTSAPSK